MDTRHRDQFGRSSRTSFNSACVTGAVILGFLALWEVCSRLFPSLHFVLPSPTHTAWQIFDRPERLLMHTGETLRVMGGGFLLAIIVAFPLAWLMLARYTMRSLLQTFFIISQCIPMFALAPLMVIWFGWSYFAIVIPTALMIFFPLTMSIYRGLCATPQPLLDYFRLNQATSFQTFYKLQLPWAAPSIFAGLRVSAGLAGVGAIAGEWAGAQKGLGMLMLESRRSADLEMVFCALTCLSVLTMAVYISIVLLEKWLFGSKPVPAYCTTVLGVVVVSLAGCQSSPGPAEKSLMLDWLPNPNHVPLYVGIEKGFFADEEVPLAIRKISDPADPLVYLSAGKVDLAISYMPSVVQTNAHGGDIKIIGILIPTPLNAFIFRKGEGINSYRDFNGKVIGYCIDSTGRACLDHLLASRNVQPGEMRNVVFDVVTALGTERIDVVYGAFWNIESEQLHSKGIETDHVALSEFGVPNYAELAICAKAGSENTTDHFIENFQSALQISIDYSKKHPEEAFEIYALANPDKSEKTLEWEKAAWEKTYPLMPSHQHVDENEIALFAKWLRDEVGIK